MPPFNSRQGRALLAALALLAAGRGQAASLTVYNSQDTALSAHVLFDKGEEFRGVIAAREQKSLHENGQISTVQVFLSSGKVLNVNEAQAPLLRGKLAKPADQVWVIDGAQICVVDAHKFRKKAGYKCPAGH